MLFISGIDHHCFPNNFSNQKNRSIHAIEFAVFFNSSI